MESSKSDLHTLNLPTKSVSTESQEPIDLSPRLMPDLILPASQRFDRKDKSRPDLMRFSKAILSAAVGFITLIMTSYTIPTASPFPVLGMMFLMLLLTIWPWTFLARGLREFLSGQSDLVRMPCMFLLHVSMAYLTGFLGLVIFSSVASLAFNPFLLPCLIGVAATGAVVLAASLMVALRLRYTYTGDKINTWALAQDLANTANPFKKSDCLLYENIGQKTGLGVLPAGMPEPSRAPELTVRAVFGVFKPDLQKVSNQNAGSEIKQFPSDSDLSGLIEPDPDAVECSV